MVKRLMILAVVLALAVAAPTMAQVEQDFKQDTESGDVDQSFTVTSGGSNGNQCANVSGEANTGNVQNSSGTIQQNSDTGDSEQEDIGSNLEVNTNNSTECKQEVNQVAAASSPKVAPAPVPVPKAAPAPVPAVKAEIPKAAASAPAPKAEVKAETPQVKTAATTSTPKAEAKSASPKQLPATGGGASLFALGAGVLLVAGGLLARKLVK